MTYIDDICDKIINYAGATQNNYVCCEIMFQMCHCLTALTNLSLVTHICVSELG